MLTRAPAHSAPIHDRAFALGQDWRFLKYLFHKCVNIIAWWSISHLSLIVRCSCTKPLPALSRRIYHSSFTLPRSTHFPHTKSPLEGTLVHQSTCRSIKMKKGIKRNLAKVAVAFHISTLDESHQCLKFLKLLHSQIRLSLHSDIFSHRSWNILWKIIHQTLKGTWIWNFEIC